MATSGILFRAAALASDPAVAATGDVGLLAIAGEGGGAGARDDSIALETARVLTGIIEFTRWPGAAGPLTLCVAGTAQHAARLDGLRLADGRSVQRRQVAPLPIALGGCNAVYIGQVDPATTRTLTAAVRGRAVLTIAEADPACRSQAMFCMVHEPRTISFRMNIDAIARSGLRVDPRVLRLAEGGL